MTVEGQPGLRLPFCHAGVRQFHWPAGPTSRILREKQFQCLRPEFQEERSFRNTAAGFGLVAIVLHWTIALLVFIMLALGNIMGALASTDPLRAVSSIFTK